MQNNNLPSIALQFPSSGSIEAYLQYANSIPLLTREEELNLARRWYEKSDVSAVQTLVLAHLRYVVRIAKNYMGYGLDLADLVQEGTIGLMKAVKKFEPSRELRLVTFAMHWIKAEIHEFVLKNWKIVKIATTKAQRKLFFRLRTMKKSLGWLSSDKAKDIADDLGVKISDVVHMESRMYSHDLSFDTPSDNDDDNHISSPIDYISADTKLNPEKILFENEYTSSSKERVDTSISNLNSREREIIEARWLHGDKPKATLSVLAKKFGVSEERIRQIEKKAMSIMGESIKNME